MKNVIGHSLYAVSGKLWRFSSIITITNREENYDSRKLDIQWNYGS